MSTLATQDPIETRGDGVARFAASETAPSFWTVAPIPEPDGREHGGGAAIVLHDLHDFDGPSSGLVRIPETLHDEVGRSFDAGEADDRRRAYAAIMMASEATASDLAALIDIDHLLDDFEDLPLERPWLRAWQILHPDCHAEMQRG